VRRYGPSVGIPLKPATAGSGDGSLEFALLVGSGGSAGFCLHGDAAALLVSDAGLASLGA